MKTYYLLFFAVLLITSCGNDGNKLQDYLSSIINTDTTTNEKKIKIEQFSNEFRKQQIQTFSFTNNKGLRFKGKTGIELIFPPNIFNCKAKDSVTITISEYTDMLSMVKANLNTTSNGKLLETNGMIYCKAYNNQKELELKKGKSFTCMFERSKKKDYKLFEGVETNNGINWLNPSEPKIQHLKQTQASKKEAKPALEISSYGTIANISDIEYALSFAEDTVIHFTYFFIKKYDIPYTDLIPFSPDGFFTLYFTLTKSGKLVYNNSGKDTPDKKYLDKIIKYIENMPIMKGYLNDSTGLMEELPVYFNLSPNGLLYEKLEKDPANMKEINKLLAIEQEKLKELQLKEEKEEKEEAEKNKKEWERIKKSQAFMEKTDKIIFEVTRMGWINCDRFYNDPRPKMELLVSNIDNYESFSFQVVFTSVKAMLSSNGSERISNVPTDEPVKILFVGMKDNATYFFTQNIITNNNDSSIKIEANKIDNSELNKYIESSLNSTSENSN